MVVVEQRGLKDAAEIRVPVKRHHVGEIVGAHIDAPKIRTKDLNVVAAAGLGQEDVPDMRVTLNDRDIAMRMERLSDGGRRPPVARRACAARAAAVADLVGKAREFGRELLERTIVGG